MSTQGSNDTVPPPLSQGVGYGIVLGVGLAFAVGMTAITHLLKKFTGENNSQFETYSTAGRKIGTGLTATAVVSSWAWSTALLSSSVVTYNYGVGGAYWFAAGCLVQISGFAVLAIQSKLKAPHAHTSLELVKVRYGTFAHVVYIFLCLVNNLIAVVNMLLGSSATISALTGMDTVASTFLLPIGVVFYSISGGLRATFVTDYIHTVILLSIAAYLCIETIQNDAIRSPAHLWELVQAVSNATPVSGNYQGSYLTMTSQGAIQFGILHTLGNWALVVMDSSYWQKAFSADMTAAAPGYILGGILYFSIPWALGTVTGLAALGLQNNPIWPAFGRALSDKETSDGLPLAYVAQAIAGKGGAVAVVLIIFMAVTSTTSAQIIGVSSIISSDVYHTYVNPNARDRSVINVSRASAIGFALVGCGVSTAFYYIGLSLTWTLYFLGIIVCPGSITLPLTILWGKQSKTAAIVSPLVGMAAGLVVWLVTANIYSEGVGLDVTTTGALLPCLWGTITSFCVPLILSVILSYAIPSPEWDWAYFSRIKLIHHDSSSSSSTVFGGSDEKKKIDAGSPTTQVQPAQAGRNGLARSTSSTSETQLAYETHAAHSPSQVAYMKRASRFAAAWGVFLFFAVWILWPFVMYGENYIFSPEFLTGWIVVSMIWLFASLLIIAFLPPWEGRAMILLIVKGALGRLPAKDQERRGSAGEKLAEDAAVPGRTNSDEGSAHEEAA